MSNISVEKGTVVSCKGRDTRDWYAWNDRMPPKPDYFHVVGEVQVPNPGVFAMLCPKVPQGTNPKILLMDLILVQQPGIWPQVITWVIAKYEKFIVNTYYDRVEIFCEGIQIADIPVEDVAMSIIGQVIYNAYSFNNSELVVFAVGLNPTPGYTNELCKKSERDYELVSTPPSEPVPQVITMFHTSAKFDEGGNLRSINIEDATGKHQVHVTPLTFD